jgi:hypothetical protein
MHPTADTLPLIISKGSGRRVMPGVRPLVAELESQGWTGRVLTKKTVASGEKSVIKFLGLCRQLRVLDGARSA